MDHTAVDWLGREVAVGMMRLWIQQHPEVDDRMTQVRLEDSKEEAGGIVDAMDNF